MTRRPRALAWAGRLLLGLGGLTLALAGVELVARHRVGTPNAWMLINSPNWYDNGIFQPDAELMQVLRPGAVGRFDTPEFGTVVRVAPAGHRGEALGDRQPGELRILAVGDSFTLAVQVDEEDSFQELLARRLSTSTGHPVRVVNAGVDGYGTGQAARYARRLAAQVQPDLILLTFFLGNDLGDNRNFRPGTYPTQAVTLPSLLSPADRRWGWSAVYLHWSAWRRSRELATDPAVRHHRGQVALFSAGADLRGEEGPTREALRELALVADALGVPARVALAPPAFALHEADTSRALEMVGLPPAADPTAPARLVAGLVPPGVEVLDLRPALLEGEEEGRTSFIFDGHWNPHGHEVVAEALTPFLGPALARRQEAPAAAPGPRPDSPPPAR
ncbi:GDSL-type esterase/lipase family protein [Myxococcota bacterium]|nr:GDSL-type esterase/lipase family protein [Myxococcota bacterium]